VPYDEKARRRGSACHFGERAGRGVHGRICAVSYQGGGGAAVTADNTTRTHGLTFHCMTLDGNLPKRRHWTGIYPNADIGREYTQTQTRHALTCTHTHELYP
jgi:hypothetical protein